MKRRREVPGREWRQFKLLFHDSWRRLLQQTVFARDRDPGQFLLWAMCLVLMPVLGRGASSMLGYPAIAVRNPAALVVMVTTDRLFFVVYIMLAAALLAALVWDALFPDRADQEVVGVLPVRPRTLAAGRLAAVITLAAAFCGALSIPPGLFFAVAQLSVPGSAPLVRIFVSHVIATMSAALFVFFTLMALRGVVGIIAGERIAARVAVVLQLLTVISFMEVFLFLPGVLSSLGRQMRAGHPDPWPLVWFASLYEWLLTAAPAWATLAGIAALATLGATAFVIVISLAPAAMMGRRALETATRERAGGLVSAARALARVTIFSAPIRGMFLFAIASLMRSRRHALVLATYLGIAVALSFVRLISSSFTSTIALDEPHRYLLTIPMVFVFLLVFGLRSAFAIPTDVDANWPLRLSPPSARQAVSVTRRLLYVLGVLPVTLLWLAAVLSAWDFTAAVTSAAFVLASGALLIEFALQNWTKVPFAAAHEPATATLRSKWALVVFFLNMWAFALPEMQRDAMRTTRGTLSYLGFFAAATLVLRLRREWKLGSETPTFDAIDAESPAVLNLSEAAN